MPWTVSQQIDRDEIHTRTSLRSVPCPKDIPSGNPQQAVAAFPTSFIAANVLLHVLHRWALRLAHASSTSTCLAALEKLVLSSGSAGASRFTISPRHLLAFGKGQAQNAEGSSGWNGLPH
jgi:hypothetical protein